MKVLRPLKWLIKRALSPETIARLILRKSRIDLCRAHGRAYWRMSRYREISGFMMDSEAVQLFQMVRAISAASPTIVEIGSWVGKSTVIIGSALGKGSNARIVCIDPFDGTGGTERDAARYRQEMSGMKRSLFDTFTKNIRDAELSSLVIPKQGFSTDVVKSWSDPIDFLFIDGNHDYEAVKQDFLDWSGFVKPGGIIALHDVWLSPPPNTKTYWKGPGQVVRELLLTDPNWKQESYTYSLFVARKSLS